MFSAALDHIHPPDASVQHRARWDRLVETMNTGGVALLPTDTVYGLHARWDDDAARRRIYALKGRPEGTPVLCLIAGMQMLERTAPLVPPSVHRFMNRHWPGGITFVVPAGPDVPIEIQQGGTIAVRWPKDAFLCDLIEAVGAPLISTSANRTGNPPIHVMRDLPGGWEGLLDAAVDGGERRGIPSTLVRVDPDGRLAVLRQGDVRVDG